MCDFILMWDGSLLAKRAHHSLARSCTCSFRGTRLSPLLLSQALMAVGQGWQVNGARALALRLLAPGEFHTHSPPVSHRFCHFPLLSIRAALSQQEGLCGRRLPRQRGAPRSMAVYRPTGATGGPFQEPAEASWHAISETFTILMKKRNEWERKGRNLDGEQQLTPLRRTLGAGLSARWRRCFLSRDGLVRKMT